jgi:ferredoxin like protein
MSVNDKLLRTRFVVDSGRPHITVDSSACATCASGPCLTVCPVQCFQRERERLVFSYENCVECGSCRIVCPKDAVSWDYPRGGFGVCYRFG